MRTWFLSLGRETQILLSLGIILVCGFLATRITKKLRLPNVSGYIVAGILIGPGVLGLIPASLVEQMDFVSDIALAFIAFGVGRFFQKETLAQTGLSVVLITVLEALAAGCAVFAAMYWGFHLDGELSLLLGAIVGGHCHGHSSGQHRYDHSSVPGQGGICQHPFAGGSPGRCGLSVGFFHCGGRGQWQRYGQLFLERDAAAHFV